MTLDQLRANWTTGAKLPAGKPFVITFDNGYYSQYSAALPELKKLGWVADENMQLTGLPPSQGGLTNDEIQRDGQGGLGAGHAGHQPRRSGRAVRQRPDRDQVAGARRTIQRRFHVPVNWFCYPSGQYDAAVIDEVKAAGFKGSTTVVPGWASRTSDPYGLPRLRIDGGTTPTELAQPDRLGTERARAPELVHDELPGSRVTVAAR